MKCFCSFFWRVTNTGPKNKPIFGSVFCLFFVFGDANQAIYFFWFVCFPSFLAGWRKPNQKKWIFFVRFFCSFFLVTNTEPNHCFVFFSFFFRSFFWFVFWGVTNTEPKTIIPPPIFCCWWRTHQTKLIWYFYNFFWNIFLALFFFGFFWWWRKFLLWSCHVTPKPVPPAFFFLAISMWYRFSLPTGGFL